MRSLAGMKYINSNPIRYADSQVMHLEATCNPSVALKFLFIYLLVLIARHAVPQFKQFVSPCRVAHIPAHVEFVVDKMALGQFLSQNIPALTRRYHSAVVPYTIRYRLGDGQSVRHKPSSTQT